MELIILITFLAISAILILIGFFLESTNPYLILFGSMILFLISMSLISEGLEIPTGETEVNLVVTADHINGTVNDVQAIPSDIRATSFNLILLLLSLYLAYFSIGTIIKENYG